MVKLTPVKTPSLFAVRKQASRFLIWLSRKIEPDCAYRYTKYLEETLKAQMDAMTYGTGAIRVEHVPYNELQKEKPNE